MDINKIKIKDFTDLQKFTESVYEDLQKRLPKLKEHKEILAWMAASVVSQWLIENN